MAGKNDKGMSSAELSSFCGQVALILEAGLPLYDGMETLAEADSGSANAQMYQEVSKGVTETGSLYDALKADKRWPSYLVEMAGVGERSGQLEQVMRVLSDLASGDCLVAIISHVEELEKRIEDPCWWSLC